MVPREAWCHSALPHVMDTQVKNLNEQIGPFMKFIRGYTVNHNSFVSEFLGLFHLSGVLLTDCGTDVFNLDLHSVLLLLRCGRGSQNENNEMS